MELVSSPYELITLKYDQLSQNNNKSANGYKYVFFYYASVSRNLGCYIILILGKQRSLYICTLQVEWWFDKVK